MDYPHIVIKDDPQVTQDDPRGTQHDPWVTQNDPSVTQDDPRVTCFFKGSPWQLLSTLYLYYSVSTILQQVFLLTESSTAFLMPLFILIHTLDNYLT